MYFINKYKAFCIAEMKRGRGLVITFHLDLNETSDSPHMKTGFVWSAIAQPSLLIRFVARAKLVLA